MPVTTTRLCNMTAGIVPENLRLLNEQQHDAGYGREREAFRKFCKQFDNMVEIQKIRNTFLEQRQQVPFKQRKDLTNTLGVLKCHPRVGIAFAFKLGGTSDSQLRATSLVFKKIGQGKPGGHPTLIRLQVASFSRLSEDC